MTAKTVKQLRHFKHARVISNFVLPVTGPAPEFSVLVWDLPYLRPLLLHLLFMQ